MWRERMAETKKWMFVGEIPLLCEARNLARQLEVEMWLDPSSFISAFNLKPVCQEKSSMPKYVA
jgi:hypothetical protein